MRARGISVCGSREAQVSEKGTNWLTEPFGLFLPGLSEPGNGRPRRMRFLSSKSDTRDYYVMGFGFSEQFGARGFHF